MCGQCSRQLGTNLAVPGHVRGLVAAQSGVAAVERHLQVLGGGAVRLAPDAGAARHAARRLDVAGGAHHGVGAHEVAARPAPPRQERHGEGAPVLVAQRAVQQEVARGVHRHQQVENVAQAAHQVVLVRVGLRVVGQRRVDQRHRRRNLADQKQHHHGDQRHCDFVLLLRVVLVAVVAVTLRLNMQIRTN
jgi:hypothetical protein